MTELDSPYSQVGLKEKSAALVSSGVLALLVAGDTAPGTAQAADIHPVATGANYQPILDRADSMSIRLLKQVKFLINHHSPDSYSETANYPGTQHAERYVVNDKLIDSLTAKPFYERLVAYVDPKDKVPLSIGVIAGSANFTFRP